MHESTLPQCRFVFIHQGGIHAAWNFTLEPHTVHNEDEVACLFHMQISPGQAPDLPSELGIYTEFAPLLPMRHFNNMSWRAFIWLFGLVV